SARPAIVISQAGTGLPGTGCSSRSWCSASTTTTSASHSSGSSHNAVGTTAPARIPARPGRGGSFPGLLFPIVLRACLRARQAPGLAQRVAQDVLDLRVEAAQLVVGPLLHGLQHFGADAQRVGLLRAHRPGTPRPLRRTWSARDSSRPLTANAMAATTTIAAERVPPATYSAAAPHRIDSAISAQRSAVPRENGSPARALQMAMPNAGRPLT